MRISQRGLYALRALTVLAERPGSVIKIKDIAAEDGLPEKFLEAILLDLKRARIVSSLRGAKGGYRLNRELSAIPIADVIAAIDGPIALTACVEGSPTGCESQGLCPMRGRWDPVNDAIRRALSEITLADMQMGLLPAFRVPLHQAALQSAAE